MRHLRPLPLFALVSCAYLPVLLIWGIAISPLRPGYEDTTTWYDWVVGVGWFINLIGIPVYWRWRTRLPHEIAATIRPALRPRLDNFFIHYWMGLIGFFTGMMLEIVTLVIAPSLADYVPIVWFFLMILGWAYSYVTTSWLTARLLRTSELDRIPNWRETLPSFGLVMLGAFGAPFLANRYRALEDVAVG